MTGALKLAELEATDEYERKRAREDLTDPQKTGLSLEHADKVGDKLREAYIKKIAQEFGTEYDEPDNDEVDDEDEDEETEQGDEFEQEENDDESSPAESLGMGDLEDELEEDVVEVKEVGFPSEEEIEGVADEVTDVTVFPEEIEEEVSEMGNELDEELNEEIVEPEMEEDIEIVNPGEEYIIELPGGQQLKLELLNEVASQLDEEVPIMSQRKEARRKAIEELLVRVAQQQNVEDIKPSKKALGDDTSFNGKPFVTQDATLGVANAGEDGPTMTLKNSEGNSLKSDPSFADNAIPTKNPELLQNKNAKTPFAFSQEQEGLFTKTINETPDPLPTMGETDDLWGDKGMQFGFDPPTQMPETTGQRKTTVANKIAVCRGCEIEDEKGKRAPVTANVDGTPLTIVECSDCGSIYPLCDQCLNDNECPVCAEIDEQNTREATGPNWTAYGDEDEVCKDNRGDNDINNDGGFRVNRKKDDTEDDENYDMEVNAAEKLQQKIAMLEQDNRELQITMAKLAKAAETAAEMINSGHITTDQIAAQINTFMANEGLDAVGLEQVRQTVAALSRKRQKEIMANVGNGGMNKEASASPIHSAKIGFNPNPAAINYTTSGGLEEELKHLFTLPAGAREAHENKK